MRVLVTGATGFIGRHAVDVLTRSGDHEVFAAGRDVAAREQPAGITPVSVDLLTPGNVQAMLASVRPTHLLHLAWNAVPGAFWTAADNLDWAAATLQLTRAFIAGGGARAVMAGSCAEYDWTTGAGRLAEDAPLRPATLYGAAKDVTRRAVFAASQASEVPIAWGRLFWLYGPGEAPGRLVSDVCRALTRALPVPVGEGFQRRDFMHVADAAAALVRALEGDSTGPFNVGSGEARAVRDVVACLAAASGREELIGWGELPARPGEPPLLEADVRRLRQTIGAPAPRSLEEGLVQTLESWRALSAERP